MLCAFFSACRPMFFRKRRPVGFASWTCLDLGFTPESVGPQVQGNPKDFGRRMVGPGDCHVGVALIVFVSPDVRTVDLAVNGVSSDSST